MRGGHGRGLVSLAVLAGIGAAYVGVVGAGQASAAAPRKPKPATQFKACIERVGNEQTRRDLKLRSGPCRRNEIPVILTIAGPKGPAGPSGPSGASGQQGPAGSAGLPGTPG